MGRSGESSVESQRDILHNELVQSHGIIETLGLMSEYKKIKEQVEH